MTFQSSSLLLIRLISDCVQYERLWKLVSRQPILTISKLSIFNHFQCLTTFNIQLWQLSRFNNFQHLTTFDNFQYSTLSQYSTTFNFQDSTFKIQQLSTFNFDNLVSNMQFQFCFRTCNLSKLRSWKLSALNFEDFHFRSLRFQFWDLNFEVWRFKFEDFHFRSLKTFTFAVWSFRYLTFKVIFGSFRLV